MELVGDGIEFDMLELAEDGIRFDVIELAWEDAVG